MTKPGEQYIASETTGRIIGSAMDVHRRLGPGFLENVYEQALAVEFDFKNIKYERQKILPVFYRDNIIKEFVCDFLVEDRVIVELKAIKQLAEIEKYRL